MVRRFHRSVYDELDELKASMDYLFHLAFEPMDNPLLPAGENPCIVCLYPHNLNVEVTEVDDEVIVTVDTIPRIENTKISADLINSNILKITCNRREERMEDTDGHHLSEQRSFSLHQEIPLPGHVMIYGAKSTFKNGVLDIHLKKVQQEQP